MNSTGLTARRYLDHLEEIGRRTPHLPGAVLCALHPAARPSKSKSLGGPFAAVERDKVTSTITVSPLGPGAAVAAMTVEMLAEVGVTSIVGVGVASAIVRTSDEWPDDAAVAVVASAISSESVSAAYGGATTADDAVTSRLCEELDAATVISYSTSTPFRLDTAAVLASEASVVDMEASALFAAARQCGIAAGLVVVISDVTSSDAWRAGDSHAVHRQVGQVSAACRSTIRSLV